MKGFLLLMIAIALGATDGAPKPHILMVIVDDFGWGTAGWHMKDNREVKTPNMNALVKEGIELNRHYVHMMCTPTRSAFQSGRLPIHVQLTLAGPTNTESGIPRNMTGIAKKLKTAGYSTHMMGKWDAGMATPKHTPKGRGYESSLNYYSHGNWAWTEAEWQGSYNHAVSLPDCKEPGCVTDFWDTDKPSPLNGTKHEELIFRDRFQSIVQSHDPSNPLFLFYAADDQLGALVQAFKDKGMWDNTLMVLSSDNGGFVKAFDGDCFHDDVHGVACFNGEAGANNYPLRGGKYTRFEGGVRVNAFVSGGFLPQAVRGTVSNEIVHIADWYSTFCSLAGVDPTDLEAQASGLPPIDSLDMWPTLVNQSKSPRDTILFETDVLLHGDFKLILGTQAGASWGGLQYPNATTATDPIYDVKLECGKGCLFNVANDPTEHVDLASDYPEIVSNMTAMLKAQVATIYRHPGKNDPACMKTAINRYGGYLGPWLELDEE